MARLCFVGVLALHYLITTIAGAGTPFLLSTSPTSYGPDGPWQAVTIALGSGDNPQRIDLFPGGLTGSIILTEQVCSGGLQCAAAGVYKPPLSNTFHNTSLPIVFSNKSYALGALSLTTNLTVATDTLVLNGPGLVGGKPYSLNNFSLSIMSQFDMIFPTGAGYPLQAGQLSLGPFANFSHLSSGDESLIPGALAAQGAVPSTSYGLHIGSPSVNPPLPLSLWLGGYDQQRLIGAVSTQPPDAHSHLVIDLLDIGIGVDSGASPFSFESQQGLLGSGNATIGSHVPVAMNPQASYLYLPNSTCTALAQNLPVTYNTKYGLYLWDTASPHYTKIVTSPSFLSFTFRNSINSGSNLTIKVPFQLLNLTLDTTLMKTPTQYFPCQDPQVDGRYSLGRAFLQAAWVGANWDLNEWYLAQAPGPNIASQPSAVPFSSTPSSSPNQWSDTWKGSWTPLVASAAGGGPAAAASRTATSTSSADGLSGGAIAGVVIGIIAFLILAFAGTILLLRRRRLMQQKQSVIYAGDSASMTQQETMIQYGRAVKSELYDNPAMLDGRSVKEELSGDELHELAGPEHRSELSGKHNMGDHELDTS